MLTPTSHLACLPSPKPAVSVDDLPMEAVRTIVRHLSLTPRAEHWNCNVPVLTVRSFFLTSGTFPAAAAFFFDTVTAVSDPFPVSAPPSPRGPVFTVASDADYDALTVLVESAGASLVSLNVVHECLQPLSSPLHSSWALAATENCTSLRELSVTVGLTRSLPLCGAHSPSGWNMVLGGVFGEGERVECVRPTLLSLLAVRGGGLEGRKFSRRSQRPSLPTACVCDGFASRWTGATRMVSSRSCKASATV